MESGGFLGKDHSPTGEGACEGDLRLSDGSQLGLGAGSSHSGWCILCLSGRSPPGLEMGAQQQQGPVRTVMVFICLGKDHGGQKI